MIRLAVIEGELLAGVCVAPAGVLAVTTNLGSNADISYYGTVAQVIPVFLLALMLEIRSRLDRS